MEIIKSEEFCIPFHKHFCSAKFLQLCSSFPPLGEEKLKKRKNFSTHKTILWLDILFSTIDRDGDRKCFSFSLSLSLLFEERVSSLEGKKFGRWKKVKQQFPECPESSTFQLSNILETLCGGKGRRKRRSKLLQRARVSGEDLVFTREHESKPSWSKFRDVPPRIREPSPSGFLPGDSIFRSFVFYSEVLRRI